MSDHVRIPELERITFFPGQQLNTSDLIALETANRELRWLHNRSLHAWGIGIGFEVTGQRGDSLVTIKPGYGIDCLGREIILTERRSKTVPAVAVGQNGADAVYYLVAAYQADSDQQVAQRRPGVCLPAGTVRLTEEPLLDWKSSTQLREGEELILARASVRNCQLSGPLSLVERRYARLTQQPYIVARQTPVGGTDWRPWDINGFHVGVLTQVDTSGGGFRTTPVYSAHIVGERSPAGPPQILVDFPGVANVTPNSFTLQVLLPSFGPNVAVNLPIPDLTTLKQKWHVVWMGIEG